MCDLNVRCCKWISDVSICELAKELRSLKILNVSNVLDVTNRSVEALARYALSLQKFVCNGCPEVEPPSLEYAAQTLPLVQIATMRTAGFIGLRPLAKGAYMRTRDKFIAQERHYKEAAKTIESYWNMYCRRMAEKPSSTYVGYIFVHLSTRVQH